MLANAIIRDVTTTKQERAYNAEQGAKRRAKHQAAYDRQQAAAKQARYLRSPAGKAETARKQAAAAEQAQRSAEAHRKTTATFAKSAPSGGAAVRKPVDLAASARFEAAARDRGARLNRIAEEAQAREDAAQAREDAPKPRVTFVPAPAESWGNWGDARNAQTRLGLS